MELLILVLLSVHLLAMNVASAGPLLCIWLSWRCDGPENVAYRLGRSLVWMCVVAFVLGMVTGAALLFLPPSENLWAALRRFPARAYWYAAAELFFSLVCLLLYAGTWRLLRHHRWLHALLALMSATNLMYHFPPMMAVIGHLAVNPVWTAVPIIDRSDFLKLIARDNVLALSAHFVLASLSVAAVLLLLMLARCVEATEDESERTRLSRTAASIALGATILQLPVGLWLVLTMPPMSRDALLGESPVTATMFFLGLLAVFLLLGQLLEIALGGVRVAALHKAAWLLLFVVLLMTAVMRYSRSHRRFPHEQAEHRTDRATTISLAYGLPIGFGQASSDSSSESSAPSGSFCSSSSGPPGSLLARINSP